MQIFFVLSLGLLAWICLSLFGEVGIFIPIIVFVVVAFQSAQNSIDETVARRELHEKISQGTLEGFVPTKSLFDPSFQLTYAVYIDEPKGKVMCIDLATEEKNIYNFDEIIECNLLEDGATIQSGGLGRAVAGGIVAGGVGAIVGATTRASKPVVLSLSIRIVTARIQNPLYEIPIIVCETDRNSEIYKKRMQLAQEIYATIVSIIYASKR